LQAALASRDQERLAAWTGTLTAMAATLSQEWQQAGADTVARQQAASDTLAQTARDIAAQTQAQAGLLETVSARLETAAGSVTQAWTEAQARQEQVNAKLAGDNQQALETAAATFEQHSAALLQTLDQSHTQKKKKHRYGANDACMARQLAVLGAGIAALGGDESGRLRSGELARVLPAWSLGPIEVHAVTETRLLPARTRYLIDFLADYLDNPAHGLAPELRIRRVA
uniref:DUF802 domain-containing protein n=1 Tax=Alcaligenes xylosoxydans xylosoxydans TaxID=85698 RepID=UPI00211B46FE